MDDLISRQAVIDALEESKRIYVDRRVIIGKMQDIVSNLPSAQPDIEKISDALYHIYRNKGTSTSAEGVAAIKYYIAEIWREIYGEEGPIWLKK